MISRNRDLDELPSQLDYLMHYAGEGSSYLGRLSATPCYAISCQTQGGFPSSSPSQIAASSHPFALDKYSGAAALPTERPHREHAKRRHNAASFLILLCPSIHPTIRLSTPFSLFSISISIDTSCDHPG